MLALDPILSVPILPHLQALEPLRALDDQHTIYNLFESGNAHGEHVSPFDDVCVVAHPSTPSHRDVGKIRGRNAGKLPGFGGLLFRFRAKPSTQRPNHNTTHDGLGEPVAQYSRGSTVRSGQILRPSPPRLQCNHHNHHDITGYRDQNQNQNQNKNINKRKDGSWLSALNLGFSGAFGSGRQTGIGLCIQRHTAGPVSRRTNFCMNPR